MMTKEELRTIYKKIRNDVNDKDIKSLKICDEIINLTIFKESEIIALYYPINSEVDVTYLIKSARDANKKFCFPKVKDDKNMEFYYVDNIKDLVIGKFGIREPSIAEEVVDPSMIDLIITPLLVFDKSNNRIGYGKGYYDRYFKRAINATKIGVAFKEQEYENLSEHISTFDHALDRIICE